MPKTTSTPLTAKGEQLYRSLSSVSFHEFTIQEFIDEVLTAAPDANCVAECCLCGERKKLIAQSYCISCTAGALKPCP